jgi:serine protease
VIKSACYAMLLTLTMASATWCLAAETSGPLKPRALSVKPAKTKIPAGHEGRVVVLKVREGISAQAVLSGGDATLARLYAVFQRFPGLRISRAFSQPPEILAEQKRRGEASTGEELADLNLFFHLHLPESSDRAEKLAQLIDALNELPEVELASLEPRIRVSQTGSSNLESKQGYLSPSPSGVDARFAWIRRGGKGDRVRVVHVEFGWDSHEDLKPPIGTYGYNSVIERDHRTNVEGVVAALHNAYGVSGIAPAVAMGYWSFSSGESEPYGKEGHYAHDVISNAATVGTKRGDIILITSQYEMGLPEEECCPETPSADCGNVPLEGALPSFSAIKAATADGRIVVASAGNGSRNLDDSVYDQIFNRTYRDSGAILVAASGSGDRLPACFTNYGTRIDVHAWGKGVATTTTGGYTETFSGTSSAAAIVAGTAAAIQGVHRAKGRSPLTAVEVRAFLAATGTPQNLHAKRIGPLPDLRAAIQLADTVYEPLPPPGVVQLLLD